MVTVSSRIKEWFFDRTLVENQVNQDRLKYLRNAGMYTRKTARSSINKKGRARQRPKNLTGKAFEKWQLEVWQREASLPPKPPHAHTDHKVFTVKNILFAYNPQRSSVIVGMVGLRSNLLGGSSFMTVPEILEYGGTAKIREKLEDVTPARRHTGVRRTLTPVQKQKMIERMQARGTMYTAGTRWVPAGRRLKPGQPVRSRTAEYKARPTIGPAVSKTMQKFGNLWFSRGEGSDAA